MNDADLTARRREIALACRILGSTGLTTPLLGHVSWRVDQDHALVRCRGPQERGLLFTTVEDVRLVALSDAGVIADDYLLPNEFPIHAEILRARPDVAAVLHAHPRSALLAGLADVPISPVFGAYDIPAYRMAAAGVPVYPRAGLIRSAASGQALAEVLADSSVALLRGHGVVTVGADVPSVIAQLLSFDELLSVSVDLARLGATPADVTADDLPDLGAYFNVAQMWRHQVGLLERQGLVDVG